MGSTKKIEKKVEGTPPVCEACSVFLKLTREAGYEDFEGHVKDFAVEILFWKHLEEPLNGLKESSGTFLVNRLHSRYFSLFQLLNSAVSTEAKDNT